MRKISESEISAYEKDGIVCLRQLFSADWISLLREAAEESLHQPGKLHAELASLRNHEGRFFHDTFIWQRNAACRRFVFESPAAAISATIMRSGKINIVFDQWLIKEPGTETKTPWHHDMPYWPIRGRQICTIWLALDSVNAESGAVQYVKGSHLWGQSYRPASFSGGAQYTEELPEVPPIDAMLEELDVVSFDLEAGDCTVHQGLVVHGSPGNQSTQRRRRAHVSRWAGDDVVFYPREGLQEMPPLPEIDSGDPLDSTLWPRVLG